MGFILGGIGADSYDRTYSDRQLSQRILGYFRPNMMTMLEVSGLIVLVSAASTAIPILISYGIDRMGQGDGGRIIPLLFALILAGGALTWGMNLARQWLSALMVGDVVLRVRQDAFAAAVRQDPGFYDQQPVGGLVSRVTSDTDAFASVVTLVLNMLAQLLQVLLIALALCAIDLRLALVALSIAPVIIAISLSFRRIARVMMRQSQRAIALVNANFQESVRGIIIAKNFRQEQKFYSEFGVINNQLYQINLRNGFLHNGIFPLLNLVAGFGTVAVVYAGGLQTLDQTLSLGIWFLFVQAIGIFWFPLTSIASFWSQFQQGLAASERIFSLIDSEPHVRQRAQEPVGALQGAITFEHVQFSYRRGEIVLPDFSLTIAAGEQVALVGQTGAGKSSLIRLIMRFYEFQAGALRIDGRDIRMLDLQQYRRQIGLVPQVPFLFSGSVADNIRYARPDADGAAVRAAAEAIGVDWIADLQQGLDTDVGERGRWLSLGQRQMVALARIILQNPRIFLLDEATASIDPFTELQIQDGLRVAMEGRTSVVIAHRLSTVRSSDRIIALRGGRIIEIGSHEQLLAAGGYYGDLYTAYFRHQSLEYIEQSSPAPAPHQG